MKKNLICLILLTLLFTINQTFAQQEFEHNNKFIKDQKEIDGILETRLKLTDSQKEYIKINRPKHKKEMEKIYSKMQKIHDKIKKAYESDMPKWQADLKTAHLKTELAKLKQKADKLKTENRKNFENILDENQKKEFEILRKELAPKKPIYRHNFSK